MTLRMLQVEAPAALAVTGEEDIDLLGILPPIAAFAFVYFLVCPVREPAAPYSQIKSS